MATLSHYVAQFQQDEAKALATSQPATQRAVAHLFPTEHLGNVLLRGLQGKLPVFRLLTEEITGPGD